MFPSRDNIDNGFITKNTKKIVKNSTWCHERRRKTNTTILILNQIVWNNFCKNPHKKRPIHLWLIAIKNPNISIDLGIFVFFFLPKSHLKNMIPTLKKIWKKCSKNILIHSDRNPSLGHLLIPVQPADVNTGLGSFSSFLSSNCFYRSF